MASLSLFRFFALLAFVWGVRATLVYDLVDARLGGASLRAWAIAWTFGVWVLPALVYARAHGPLRETARFVRPRRGALAALVACAFLGGMAFVELVIRDGTFVVAPPDAVLAYAAAHAMAPLGEELTFRGVALASLEPRFGLGAHALVALGFIGIHVPHWLYSVGLSWELGERVLSLVPIALTLGALSSLTRSIVPGVILHLAHNVLAAMIAPA